MANADKPFGFKVGYTLTGSPASLRTYKSTAAIIYPGDLVKFDGSGRILSITSAADNPMGVAATYGDATAGNKIQVFDDLVNTVFEVQCDGADLADDTVIGLFYDPTVTTGDTTMKFSKQELDSDASAQDTLAVIGLVPRSDNVWGEFAKVFVKIRVDSQANVIATT